MGIFFSAKYTSVEERGIWESGAEIAHSTDACPLKTEFNGMSKYFRTGFIYAVFKPRSKCWRIKSAFCTKIVNIYFGVRWNVSRNGRDGFIKCPLSIQSGGVAGRRVRASYLLEVVRLLLMCWEDHQLPEWKATAPKCFVS